MKCARQAHRPIFVILSERSESKCPGSMYAAPTDYCQLKMDNIQSRMGFHP